MTELSIDLDAITAIDVHVHVESDGHGCLSLDQELMDASAAYFRSSDNRTPTVEFLADRYREHAMAAAMNSATAFARCAAGNQYVRYRMMPGKKPASATPSMKRIT